MKRVNSVCLLVVLVMSCFTAVAEEVAKYRLGAGDRIEIKVYGEEDLTKEELISDSGYISYPFLGNIQAAGKTVKELRQDIYEGLKGDYLLNPVVSVGIVDYRQFYINGEVENPGGFSFQPGLTVRKAISLAQGFTERASKSNIFVISEGAEDKEPVKVSLSDDVQPGDIIIVKQSFF